MAPFQYQPYENRLAGSIGDILARRGEIAAAAAQRAGVILSNGTREQGAINARAQEQSGQAWAGAASQAAGAVAAIPGQVRQAQTADLQREGMQLEVDQRKRQASDLQAIDKAYQASDGSRESIINALPGHLRGSAAKDFESFDKLHAESVELQQKADAAKIAAFASAGMTVRAHGYDPTSAQIVISDLKKKYRGDQMALGQVQQFEEALHADPSAETVKRIIDPILQADPKTREDLQKQAADEEAKRNHDLEHGDRAATLGQQQARDAEIEARDTAAIANNKLARELEGRRVAAEEANARTAGAREKREQSVYDQTYGAGGTNPDGTPKARKISATAQAIAEYKMQPPSPRSRASGAGKAIMDDVMAANPDYDETQYASRSAMRKAFTSGNQGQQLGALNTAIAHLGLMDEVAASMQNGDFKPGNDLYNKVRTMFGSSAVTNFEFARDIMAGELATAMKKSGATDVEIAKVSKSLDASASPEQLRDAVRKVALPMIGGKAGTMEEQYHATMGARDPFSVYTPSAKAALEKFGAQTPAAAVPGGGGKGGGPGTGAGPKEGDVMPITAPGYPAGAEQTFKGGKWIRTK